MELVDILQSERAYLIIKSEDLHELAEILSQPKKQIVIPDNDQPITQTVAIKRWDKTRQTFVNWRKKGLITAYTINGRIYYKPSEIMTALQKVG